MIKKAILISIVTFYASISSAEITLLSKAHIFPKQVRVNANTYCIEGYVVAAINSTAFQLLNSGGDPLTCKGKVHESINR
jgi:hypothetical protein